MTAWLTLNAKPVYLSAVVHLEAAILVRVWKSTALKSVGLNGQKQTIKGEGEIARGQGLQPY